jgi:ATP-dependent Zn protease
MSDPFKRRMAAQILGQAYYQAYNAMRQNRAALEKVADALVEKRELHGDEVVDLLEEVRPIKPTVDYLDKTTWPKL